MFCSFLDTGREKSEVGYSVIDNNGKKNNVEQIEV